MPSNQPKLIIYFCLLMCFFISNQTFAQNIGSKPAAPIPLAEIKQMPTSAEKIDQVLRYARNPRIIYNEDIKTLVSEAYQTAVKLNRDDLKTATLSTRAILELNLGNIDSAISYIKKAEVFLPQLNDRYTTVLLSDLTRIYNNAGDYERTIFYYNKLEDFTKDKPEQIIHRVLNLRNRVNLNMRLGKIENIKTDYQLIIKLAKQSNNQNLIKDTQFIYANMLLNLNKDDEAFEVLKDLIPDLDNMMTDRKGNFFDILSRNYEEAGDYKNAFIYYEKLFNLPTATVQQKGNSINKMFLIAHRLKNFENIDKYFVGHKKYGAANNNFVSKKQYELVEAKYYHTKNNIKLAKNHYLKAYQLKMGNAIAPPIDLEALTGLATIYTKEKNIDSAAFYLQKTNQLLQKHKFPAVFKLNYINDLKSLSINSLKNKDTLVKQLENEIILKDTLHQIRLSKIINELETKYKVSEKEKALELANKKQQLQKLEIEQQKTKHLLIAIVGAIVIVLLILLAYILLQRKKQAKILHEASVNDLKNLHQIEIMNTLTEGQELEKKKVAEQLHDEVGAMISIAKLNLNTLQQETFKAGTNADDKLEITKKLLDDISHTIRNISHSLMPIALEKYGFKAAILDLLTAIKTSNTISVEYVLEGLENTTNWPKNFTLSVYRIIQEILNNVIKHAEASHLFVQIIDFEKNVTIYIEDNGKGFKTNVANNGAGIKLLETNVAYLAGKLEIKGEINQGTFALIELPIPTNPKHEN